MESIRNVDLAGFVALKGVVQVQVALSMSPDERVTHNRPKLCLARLLTITNLNTAPHEKKDKKALPGIYNNVAAIFCCNGG